MRPKFIWKATLENCIFPWDASSKCKDIADNKVLEDGEIQDIAWHLQWMDYGLIW
jgi:hypothetical protein